MRLVDRKVFKLFIGLLTGFIVMAGALLVFSKFVTGDALEGPKYLYDQARYGSWTDAEKEQLLIDRIEAVPRVVKTEFTLESPLASPKDRFLEVWVSPLDDKVERKITNLCRKNGLWWSEYSVTCLVHSIEPESNQ